MHILIVDDSRAMKMIVQRTLRQAGYTALTVKEASSGKEALELLSTESVDLVLSDWNMPEITRRLAHAIRHLACPPNNGDR